MLTLAASEVVRRRVDTSNQRILVHALFVINALLVGSLLVFGLAGNFFFAVLAYWSIGAFRSMNRPIFTTWLTVHVDSKVRATVISMWGQVDALGQIAGGPPVGTSVRWYRCGQRDSFACTAVVCSRSSQSEI